MFDNKKIIKNMVKIIKQLKIKNKKNFIFNDI